MLALVILPRVRIDVFSVQGDLARKHLGTFLTWVSGWAMDEGVIASLSWGSRGLQLWAVGCPAVSFFPSSLPVSRRIRAAMLVAIVSLFLPLHCGSQWVPSVRLHRLCPSPAASQFPSLALPGLSSPQDLRLPSLSLVLLFPSPVGGQIYRLYLWVYMYICKGIYANLNISVRNTLFTLSRLLPCLRAHPSSAQCHHV